MSERETTAAPEPAQTIRQRAENAREAAVDASTWIQEFITDINAAALKAKDEDDETAAGKAETTARQALKAVRLAMSNGTFQLQLEHDGEQPIPPEASAALEETAALELAAWRRQMSGTASTRTKPNPPPGGRETGPCPATGGTGHPAGGK